MKILIVCNGGVSTGILAAAVRREANENDEIRAVSVTKVNDLDWQPDVVLVAPQIGHLLKDCEQKISGIPMVILPKEIYGNMNGKESLNKAKEAYADYLEKKKESLTVEEKKMSKLKVTLCCNGGLSTGILCKKIIAEAEKQGYEIECEAYGVTALDKVVSGSDIILVGPQIKFRAKEIAAKYPDIPVDVIEMRDYGSMNGAKIFNDAKAKYNW